MKNIIREKRKELGLSQEELAKRCGVSRQTVNAIENNKYDLPLTILLIMLFGSGLLPLALAFCLARELRLPVDQLFFPDWL